MNFDWRRTTEEDLQEFNKWHESVKGTNKDNITKYIGEKPLGENVLDLVKDLNCDNTSYRARSIYYNNELVGVVVAIIVNKSRFSHRELRIHNLVVNPFVQGKGIGTAILFDVVKNCEQIFNFTPSKITSSVAKSNVASNKAHQNAKFKIDKKLLRKYNNHFEHKL